MNTFKSALLLLLLALFACTRHTVSPHQRIVDGKYDVGFPLDYKPDSIAEIMESVRLLNAHIYYDHYPFPENATIRKGDITPQLLDGYRETRTVVQDFTVGTATLIYHQGRHMAILTCAHVVDFPDTLYHYYPSELPGQALLQAVSVKKRQRNTLINLREVEEFEILAVDREADVAILGAKMLFKPSLPLPVFRNPLGFAAELNWGTFVYMVGFPSGKQMITSGLVSAPNRNREHDFLVDGLFNRGFSGGLVLALRDGLPNFELVGLLSSVAAEDDLVLAPDPQIDSEKYPPHRAYRENVFLQQRKQIKYGITFAVSAEQIATLIEKNKARLRAEGFDSAFFFK